MSEKPNPWNRFLWGVKFTGNLKSDPPKLLGEAWDDLWPGSNRPMRVLLFSTREAARVWCRRKNREWKAHGDLRGWKARPVKVHELIYQSEP